MKLAIAVVPAIFLAGCWHGYAGSPIGPAGATDDPPGRVARISYMNGPVSFRAAGTEAWVAGELNRPVTTGDEIWTDENARAELDIGHAFVRLDSRTSLKILNLDDRGVQASLSAGTAQVKLRTLDEEDEFEVATPQVALTLLRTGDYRIGTGVEGNETQVTVRAGQVEAIGPDQSFTVRALQKARITGVQSVSHEIDPAPPLDTFDDFCRTRDSRTEKGESVQYVSPNVIGREDLDEHGSWRVHVTWGPVWHPRAIPPGWAPYRFGHWVWIEPWGWTWIEDAPWGFAPFHYGRWVFVDSRWGWVPGPRRIRAVYAPALVVFAGGGPGLRYHFSIGAGLGVAWFPLGPREVYIPPYRASRTYVTNVNISHTVITNTTNIWKTDVSRQRYANRNVGGALTAVPEDVFVRGRQVSTAAVRVSPQDARAAHIGGSAPPIVPERGSVAPAGPPAPRPPEATLRRQTTVRRTEAPPAVPFERKRPALENDPGRPLDPARVEEMRREQPQAIPQHRQVTPRPQARTAPPAPRTEQAQPPRASEDRRRTIEHERQRSDARQPQSQPQKQPPGRRR